MITISSSLFINGLREIGASLKTQIKHISSVLAHIGSVTNTGTDCYQSSVSFYKRNQPPAPAQDTPFTRIKLAHTGKPRATVPLTVKINPMIAELQLRPESHPSKTDHRIASVKKRRAPLPPSQNIGLIHENKSPDETRARPVNAVAGKISRKSHRAPLPPLSSTLITQLEQTIEKDKQSATWNARFNSPSSPLTPTRRAPLPPLSEPMIERLVQMIESDRQSPERTLLADAKPVIKDIQFNTLMRKEK